MSAPSTSLSFSLDALLSQPRPSSPSSSSFHGSRAPLSLNHTRALLSSLEGAPPLRSLRRLPRWQSFIPADPSPWFPTFPTPHSRTHLDNTPKAAAFLGPDGVDKLQILDGFCYARELPQGTLEVRAMSLEEVRATVELLASSFADALWIPGRYVRVLEFLVAQYVVQKRVQRPHAATLVGYYRERGAEEAHFVATAEVSFNASGANISPPSPVPPRDAPYICNMTVKRTLRRRGIGWHLLKACEELITRMTTSREVYLHCRVIDDGPLSLYKKAGYSIVKTDSFLVWLRLQQRKHLMCKELESCTFDLDDLPI